MKIPKRMLRMMLILILLIGSLCVTAYAEGTIMQGIGFVNTDGLRVRTAPSTTSAVAGTAKNRDCVVIVSQEGDWFKVIYNLKEGYMFKDYVTAAAAENAELGYGKVVGTSVNLRSGPGVSYNRVAAASGGEQCYILGINQGWYKVIYKNDICYIRSDYLELTELPYENRDSSNTPKFFRGGKSTGVAPSAAVLNGTAEVPSASGAEILSKAKEYLGTRYVYGGASPNGFDCSGYVYYILKCFGFSPARTPADQYSMGTPITSKANLKPGDIVFFAGTAASGISHVGIYAGNGQFIHAPNSRSVVSYSDLTSGYWAEHYYGACRVANK